MIHLPLWLEIAVLVVCGGFAAWQERKEFVRLWRELRTGKRIESGE